MNQVITAKLKLYTTPEQFKALRETQLAYRDGLNFVSGWAFDNGKTSNQVKIQDACYDLIRSEFGLPAQMACNIPRTVGATYKGLWTKVRQNAEVRKLGYTKKRYKGLDKPAKYVSPTITYNYGRDYGFKKDRQVSILTLQGRIIVSFDGYSKHIEIIQHGRLIPERQTKGAIIGAAKLWYDKPHKQFYLLVSLEVAPFPSQRGPCTPHPPEVQPTAHKQVVGVDVGRRYLAVATNTKNETAFYPGREVVHKANHYVRLRKRLQQKGTRSAKRRQMAIGGRERRLKLDTNHTIAKRIIERYSNAVIGIEELTGIRERTKRNKGKRATWKQRRENRMASKWAFSEFHSILAYKANLNGSVVVKVDANNTSKGCPCCGYVSDNNRPNKGLSFVCTNCGYTLHADLVGARNIALRTLLVRQDWTSTGVLSVRPDESDYEAKAARLKKYAELRWSPDSSP